MKKVYLLTWMILLLGIVPQVYAQDWEKLGTDPVGDGFRSFEPDVKTLYYLYNEESDSVWFLIDMHDDISPDSIGLNIAFNIKDAGRTTKWNGPQNTAFELNRLVTFWYHETFSGPTGVIGIADANGFEADDAENLQSGGIFVIYDTELDIFILEFKRDDVFRTDSLDAEVMASVGIPGFPNDDIPNQGSFHLVDSHDVTDTTTSSIQSRHVTLVKAFPNPASGHVNLELPESDADMFMLTLVDIRGRVVHESGVVNKPGEGKIRLNLPSLRRGYYTLYLLSPGVTFRSQILIR